MNEKYLSIIIPVYNTEKYLSKLFSSIPSEYNSEIELIFVDDGSEDNSLSIIEHFQKKYKNVFLEKQSHKGAPAARNRGLLKSSGEYIYFFDSDDYFEEGVFSKIIPILQKEKPDLVIGNGYVVDENYNQIGEKFQGIQNKTSSSKKELFFIDSNPGNKIFRKKIITENEIEFDDVTIHQDLNFYLKYIPFCNNVRFLSDYMYSYLVRSNSIAHKVSKKIAGVINAMEGVYQYYRKRELLHQYEKELEYNYVKHLCFQIEKLYDLKNITEYQEIGLKFIEILKTLNYKTNEYISKERIQIIDNLLEKETLLASKNYNALFAEKQENRQQRLDLYNQILLKWIYNKINKREIFSYFYKKELYRIAIYGMGTLGKLLYEDLKDSKIKVSYFIDQQAGETYFGNNDLPVIKSEQIEEKEIVDAIIVTPIHAYNVIRQNLEDMGINIKIFSLQEIL